MTKKDHEMITARRNLVEKMNRENRTDEEKYQACMNLKYEEYITEIHNAEEAIEKYAKYYHARRFECPDSFKFLMFFNGWCSPFVALNELLKVIDKNEMLLKRKQKETGIKSGYKSRYREMMSLIQRNSHAAKGKEES